MHSITFLGTGGGRFVLLSQRRYSGGLWLDLESTLILDPGPGALIRALQFKKDPGELDAVLVSHKHLDHYNDAELMVESMTHGMKKDRGCLVINKNTLGYISDYHKSVNLITPNAKEKFRIKDLKIQAIPTYNHANGIGFKFLSDKGTITCTSDTAYSEELIEYYKDSKILILNTIFPASKEIKTHLNTETAALIVEKARPELAIIQHFGLSMLNAGPEREAAWMENETGVKTIAARDGMTINLESMEPETKKGQLRLARF
ncbi:MAG: MBL fold metallo-hydrolase [Candidatus Altiarchaeota archaeon]|nr:MBL fold metallo-hydrolase [Candidatus Altiarchaeota archaeon]